MVYLKDISVFDESVKQFINGLKDKSASKAKNKLVEFVGGDEVYDAEIAQFDKPGQLEAYLEEVKRSMPGLGTLMEDLSRRSAPRWLANSSTPSMRPTPANSSAPAPCAWWPSRGPR